MFEQLIERQNKCFESNIKQLNYYCEKYPDIKTFVECLLDTTDTTDKHDPWENYVSGQLQMFMYELGFGISGFNNEINFNLDWSSTLASFIGNYFLDDSAFNFKLENGVWKIYPDFDNGVQDPMRMVYAARDNAIHYWKVDNWIEFQRENRINKHLEKE